MEEWNGPKARMTGLLNNGQSAAASGHLCLCMVGENPEMPTNSGGENVLKRPVLTWLLSPVSAAPLLLKTSHSNTVGNYYTKVDFS